MTTSEPLTDDEIRELHHEVEEIQARFRAELSEAINALKPRMEAIINRWEDALTDLHPDIEAEISDWGVNPEGLSTFTIRIKYPLSRPDGASC